MRKLTCDRCHHEGVNPRGEIREVAVTHWGISEDSGMGVTDLIKNLDLCGQCRTALRTLVRQFLKNKTLTIEKETH